MTGDKMHKCRDCDREIPEHIPCCIYCKSKYMKEGTCWWCGVRPRKERRGKAKQSQYCVECHAVPKGIKSSFTNTNERTLSTRGSDIKGRKCLSAQQAAHMQEPGED